MGLGYLDAVDGDIRSVAISSRHDAHAGQPPVSAKQRFAVDGNRFVVNV
jgi:hypothetical protein